MQCSVDRCPFFANEGCEGTCSKHAVPKRAQHLFQLQPRLPAEIVQTIWRTAAPCKNDVLTDDEIAARLGLDPVEIFVDADTVRERLLWIRHQHQHHHFMSGGDALQLPENKKLRKEDAERLMMAIDDSILCRQFFENALVMKTFHRGGLTKSLFPVGLCYYGTAPCLRTMPTSLIRRLIVCRNLAEGGGGGGSGFM